MTTETIDESKPRISQRITRLDAPKRRIRFGVLQGQVSVSPDFDTALPDKTLAGFEGR